jgi:sterol desaturase/sphingolipid hydroxylase (fatty acid hydroxylase superfamily)
MYQFFIVRFGTQIFFVHRIWSGLIVLSAVISIAIAASSVWDEAVALWDVDTSAKIAAMKDGTHNPYREFNEFLNKVFYGSLNLPFAPSYFYSLVGNEAGFYLSCYFRDLALGTLVYWITAGLWHLTIYTIRGQEIFANNGRPFPKFETIADQMMLAQSAILIYAALPLVSEYLIQNKLTLAYYYIDQIGWGMYAVYFIIYIALVEIGIYWMHRTLHTNKFLYKYIHSLHHKYNKPTTLTPWASIAFNPIDGILQVRIIYYNDISFMIVSLGVSVCHVFISGPYALFHSCFPHILVWSLGNKYS